MKRYLLEHKNATVPDMARHFSVSGQTIRRDFEVLESEGFLLRSYGGAILLERKTNGVSNQVKREMFVDEKQLICSRAVPFIRPNDCIYIDHSTTALNLCSFIKNMPLTVVTNSLRVITELASSETVRVISTSGRYYNEFEGFFGSETLSYLRQHCMDKAFLSCRSVDANRGPNDSDEVTASVRQKAIENSDEVFMLVDHTKLDRSSFTTICGFSDIDYFITDRPLSDEWKQRLSEYDVTFLDAEQ